MATKDDQESFTVEVVALTPGKFDITGYAILPTPPITRGTTFNITMNVKNIGQEVAILVVKLVDSDTESVIRTSTPDSVAGGATKWLILENMVMPAHDYNLRLEAWRS